MDAAEQLARDRDIATPPDDRDQRPHSKGTQVTMDDDLIIWLTKDLSADNSIPHLTAADEDARRKLLVSHLI